MFYSGIRECMWERECTRERKPKYGDINSSISITTKTAFSVVLIGWIEGCTQNKPATSITAPTTITYVTVCVFVSGFVHDLVCVCFCLCPYLCIPICWKAVCHCQSGDIYIYVCRAHLWGPRTVHVEIQNIYGNRDGAWISAWPHIKVKKFSLKGNTRQGSAWSLKTGMEWEIHPEHSFSLCYGFHIKDPFLCIFLGGSVIIVWKAQKHIRECWHFD